VAAVGGMRVFDVEMTLLTHVLVYLVYVKVDKYTCELYEVH
jgi:hypothetical protein